MGEEAIVFDESPPADDLTPQLTEPKQPEEKTAPIEEAKVEEVVDDKPEPFSEKQQAKFNEEIARKVAKQREAERKATQLEQEAEALRLKVQQYEAPVRPDIPPPPDPYDEGFSEKVRYRDAMIARQAQFDAHQAYLQQQQAVIQQQRQQAEQDKLRTTVTTYSEKAEKLGISAQELAQAGQIVAAYGISNEVAEHILNDEQGPAITRYLAKNPLEMDKVMGMTPLKAAVYIESTIKAAAKSPQKMAPEPTETLRGSGAREKERGPKGATFE
jgi:hypothetical protein